MEYSRKRGSVETERMLDPLLDQCVRIVGVNVIIMLMRKNI